MLASVLIALVVSCVLAPVAEATFPGRNGDLLVNERNRGHASDYSALLRIDPASGAVTRTPICGTPASSELSPLECYNTGPPAASPDGGSVAFTAADVVDHNPYNGRVTFSLRVLSLTTGELRYQPLAGVTLPYETIVRWRPDRSFAVAASHRLVWLAGPHWEDLGRLVANATAPDVSSGGRVAFVRRGNVYVLKRDGTARRLTRKGGDRPSWSPRGRLIAFSRKGYVWTVPAKGGRERRITRGFDPVWSPDGRQIAYFRAIPDPAYFGDVTTYLFSVDRSTGRARRVSPQVIAVPDDLPPNGLDWQAAR
jgi:Tol biopolymer transport system component